MGRCVREGKKALKHLVVELYSAPRVTAAAKLLPDMRHIPGLALDLTTVDAQGRPWGVQMALPRGFGAIWRRTGSLPGRLRVAFSSF